MSAKLIGWALKRPDLTQPEKMLLVVLADRSRDGLGLSWYSQETLAKLASCSKRTVTTALASLQSKRLLLKKEWFKEDGGRTSDRIFLAAPCCAPLAWGGVQEMRTIPSTPYGVRGGGKKGKEGARHGGGNVLAFAKVAGAGM